jgi:hypothetical protein
MIRTQTQQKLQIQWRNCRVIKATVNTRILLLILPEILRQALFRPFLQLMGHRQPARIEEVYDAAAAIVIIIRACV